MKMNHQCHLGYKKTATQVRMEKCHRVDLPCCAQLPLMKMEAQCGMLQENNCVLFATIFLCHELSFPVGIPAFVPVVLAS